MNNITNPIFNELLKLKLVKKKNIIKISTVVRDHVDKKIKVLKDKKSQIIFLQKSFITSKSYKIFKSKKHKKMYSAINQIQVNKKIFKTKSLDGKKGSIGDSDRRRLLMFKKYLLNKEVLDFGCNWGTFLNLIKKYPKNCSGLELRKACVNYIKKNHKHIDIKDDLSKFNKSFDLVTLFHVLEHIPNQVQTLKEIKKKIKRKGKIIIEVPSAVDYLISHDLPEFKKFTFWSEHLILHTEESLKKILKAAGFKKIKVRYYQQYGFANHLGWFIKKKPGGHEIFKKYVDKKIDLDYRNYLKRCKQTDTLIAIAEKN